MKQNRACPSTSAETVRCVLTLDYAVQRHNAVNLVSDQTKSTLVLGRPRFLFEAVYRRSVLAPSYEVSADGQRFLMISDRLPLLLKSRKADIHAGYPLHRLSFSTGVFFSE